MQPDSYINARGEQVMPLHVFAELDREAVQRSLLPAKPHVNRRERRIRNGRITPTDKS